MILFTSDIDWVPDVVIEYMLNIFTKYDILCSLFCTYESKVTNECNRDLFGIAEHLNFNSLLFGSDVTTTDAYFEDVINIYPEAIALGHNE
jgi:hypothetical protein